MYFYRCHFFPLLLLLHTKSVDLTTLRTRSQSQLVIISYDGLRYDIISPENTPYLLNLRTKGLYAHRLTGVFPTKTYPNHFTVATGLYPEYHGVLGGKLFDWKTQKELNYSEELFKFNKDVVPLWTLNEINGGTSGCLMWPGSEFAYKNVTCSYTIRYQTGKSLYELANIAFEWLTNGKRPANLVMMYINQPDRAGHLHGFASNKYMEQLRKVDDMASYLHRLLTSQSMNIDIVHISDHGMTSVTKARIIDLEKAMPSKGNYRIYSSTPVLQIVPEEGKFNTVLKKLQEFANSNEHFAVYDTKTFPGRWHCNNSRIGPITVVANLGYAFQDVVTNIVEICGGNLTSANISDIGIHGYDNVYKEMDGIFLASGPSFGPAKIAGRVKIIDLFDLFCHILEIENIPKSNGSIEGITSVLFERNQLESIATLATILFMVAIIVLMKMVFMIFERRKPYMVWK